MNSSTSNSTLSAYVRTVIDDVRVGKQSRAIRRPLLIERATGLLHELPTTYIFRELGQKSLNTQVAVLYDLAFYLEWVRLKQGRSRGESWKSPEARTRAGQLALTEGEVADLATWCQTTAKDLCKAVHRERQNIRVLPAKNPVDSGTTNRRLDNICNYLTWLIRNTIEGTLTPDDKTIEKSIYFQEKLRLAFDSEMNGVKKAPPVKALDSTASKALYNEIATTKLFPDTPHGRRDQLIARLLLASGLRASELLKLYAADIDSNYRINAAKTIAVIKVIRRPNDVHDDRLLEPAVKTLPGPVAIRKDLANDIINHIITDRRNAVDGRRHGKETPYLFVCLSGPRVGKPISRRNLNRIISKLTTLQDRFKQVSPHVLRHTHFTDFAEAAMSKDKTPADIKSALLSRGHWSPNSEMPARYIQIHIIKMQDEYNEARERALNEHE